MIYCYHKAFFAQGYFPAPSTFWESGIINGRPSIKYISLENALVEIHTEFGNFSLLQARGFAF